MLTPKRQIIAYLLLLALDLLSKLYFSISWPFSVVFNPGIAFSFMCDWNGAPLTFCAFNLVVGSSIIVYWWRHRGKMTGIISVGLLLMSCGAIGNACDRIINLVLGRPPFVTDFINYGVFVGNIADIYVCLGAFFLCVSFVKNSIK